MSPTSIQPTYINWELLRDTDRLSDDFRSAKPFPHVVLSDFLADESAELREELSSLDEGIWNTYAHEFQRGKQICSDSERLPAHLQRLVFELSSPKFLQALQALSGIEGLIPDPYLEGGGLHRSGPGGILRPHTDFHLYSRLGLYRQLNVLLYLNPEWDESWGGCLELYRSMGDDILLNKVVVPDWGRCIIFLTDDRSVHGFSRPIVGDHRRQSLALYYYTSRDAADFGGDYSTYWYRTQPNGRKQRAKRHIHSLVLKASRAVAILAHRLDPDIDRGHHRD